MAAEGRAKRRKGFEVAEEVDADHDLPDHY